MMFGQVAVLPIHGFLHFLPLFLLHLPSNLEGAKLLMVSPSLSPSLLIQMGRLADILVEAGHNVTVWIPEMQSNLESGTKLAQQVVRMTGLMNAVGDIVDADVFDEALGNYGNRLIEDQAMVEFCEAMLKRKDELEFLRAAQFDLAFTNMIDLCFTGLLHHLGIPKHIWISTGPLPDSYRWLLGIPHPLSIAPTLQQTVLLGPKMDTWERIANVWQYALSWYSLSLLFHSENALFRRYISPNFPPLEQLTARLDLAFVNGDQFLDPAEPTLDKVISIGGLLVASGGPLNSELLQALESGPKGAVFFSLGSMTNTRYLDPAKFATLLRAFAHFSDYSFIVKLTKGHHWGDGQNGVGGNFSGRSQKPSNVHFFDWMPQTDLLAHPNVRLFISHAGYNSILESTIRGIPLLLIPLFFDQRRNAKCAEYRGHARVLSKRELLDEGKVRAEIGEMLQNQSYQKAAQRLAKLFREKPGRPERNVLEWTNFVLANGPLAELVPESVGMSLVEYFCLDLLLYALAVLAIVLWVACKTIGWAIRHFQRRGKRGGGVAQRTKYD